MLFLFFVELATSEPALVIKVALPGMQLASTGHAMSTRTFPYF